MILARTSPAGVASRVRGVPGAVVTLQYTERLTPEGGIDQEHIGIFVPSGETQTDRYTLKGGGEETWEPRFTYHGFQYCKVSVEGEADILGIEARVVHTAFDSAGRFGSSDETLNRLQACFRRSYTGNFVGIPTACRRAAVGRGRAPVFLRTYQDPMGDGLARLRTRRRDP